MTFWFIQIPGWLLFIYLVATQCTAAVSYAFAERHGFQETADEITEVGVAFFKGFAFADLVFYVPLLGAGLAAHALGAAWAPLVIGGALCVTIYWPIVCLRMALAARDAPGWHLKDEMLYWVILVPITLWAAAGLIIV